MEFESLVQTNYKHSAKDKDDEIKLIEVFEKYKSHWKWIILSLIISLFMAFTYLRYSHAQYEVTTTIFINDKDSGGLQSELSAFEDLGVISKGSGNSVNNETGILLSRSIMEKIVKKLGISVTYYTIGKVNDNEIYGSSLPIRVNFLSNDSIINRLDTIFKIIPQSKIKYALLNSNDEIVETNEFGKNIKTKFGEINITFTRFNDIVIGEPIMVKIAPLKNVSETYRSRLKIESEPMKTSLVTLRLTDNVKAKAQDILNHLVIQYNEDAISFKTLISKNTDKFINDRIIDITSDLDVVDKGVEEFKMKNKLTDLEYEAGLVLDSNTEIQKKINELSSQLKLVEYVIEYLNQNSESLIPENLGIKDEATSENSIFYNRLILERNRIIKGSSVLNPSVVNLDAQIRTLRTSIEQSLINLKSSLMYSLNEAKNQEFILNQRRNIAPTQEREYQNIKRTQQIIETLYLYLLQKKEENAISLGIPVPNAKIIDLADGDDLPVSPKPKLTYLIAVLLGLFLPYFFVSIVSLLDIKVHASEDVERVLKAPIIGEIPWTKSKKKVMISSQANNNIAESLRLLRTNVNFMLSGVEHKTKSIFVTSTISGEGKSFISLNLASTLALLNKKILLIGADIRKPKLALYLGINSNKGLTQYLSNNRLNVSDLIVHDEVNNFDILFAGETPPNPSELLVNGRFEDLISYGKEHYDYLIIDTPPVNMVTDTLLLAPYADLFIYVVRAEFLDKRLLHVPKSMYKNNRLPNMAMLINAIEIENSNYGYGYGYADSKISWWKRIFKKG